MVLLLILLMLCYYYFLCPQPTTRPAGRSAARPSGRSQRGWLRDAGGGRDPPLRLRGRLHPRKGGLDRGEVRCWIDISGRPSDHDPQSSPSAIDAHHSAADPHRAAAPHAQNQVSRPSRLSRTAGGVHTRLYLHAQEAELGTAQGRQGELDLRI